MGVFGATSWSDGELSTIKKLWPTAVAFSEIHKLLPGRSRSAVCGMAARMGLSRPPHATKPAPYRAERKPAPPRPVAARPPAPVFDEPPPGGSAIAVAPTPIRRWPGLPPGGGDKDLVELASGECKFPVGEESGDRQRFCAAPAIDGQPYCSSCGALAYKSQPKADLTGLRRVA